MTQLALSDAVRAGTQLRATLSEERAKRRPIGNVAWSRADRLMMANFLTVEVRHYAPAEQLHAPEHIAV